MHPHKNPFTISKVMDIEPAHRFDENFEITLAPQARMKALLDLGW